jgi:hypothetical protein
MPRFPGSNSIDTFHACEAKTVARIEISTTYGHIVEINEKVACVYHLPLLVDGDDHMGLRVIGK